MFKTLAATDEKRVFYSCNQVFIILAISEVCVRGARCPPECSIRVQLGIVWESNSQTSLSAGGELLEMAIQVGCWIEPQFDSGV